MNGYLQRLASSVLRPGGTIRPVLAPIFSKTEDAMTTQRLENETTAAQVLPQAQPIQEEFVASLPRFGPLRRHDEKPAHEVETDRAAPRSADPPPLRIPLVASAPQRV